MGLIAENCAAQPECAHTEKVQLICSICGDGRFAVVVICITLADFDPNPNIERHRAYILNANWGRSTCLVQIREPLN